MSGEDLKLVSPKGIQCLTFEGRENIFLREFEKHLANDTSSPSLRHDLEFYTKQLPNGL